MVQRDTVTLPVGLETVETAKPPRLQPAPWILRILGAIWPPLSARRRDRRSPQAASVRQGRKSTVTSGTSPPPGPRQKCPARRSESPTTPINRADRPHARGLGPCASGNIRGLAALALSATDCCTTDGKCGQKSGTGRFVRDGSLVGAQRLYVRWVVIYLPVLQSEPLKLRRRAYQKMTLDRFQRLACPWPPISFCTARLN